MSSEIVFFVEEPSMQTLLNELLPKLLQGASFKVIPHEGKSDLERSFPRKMRAWRTPNTHFVVMRDNDGGDCQALKTRLAKMCAQAGRPDSLVRIVCQELEAWYLGDLNAVDESNVVEGSNFTRLQEKQNFRIPDNLGNAKEEFKRLAPSYQPIKFAREIAPHLNAKNSRSSSFRAFVDGVSNIAQQMQGAI